MAAFFEQTEVTGTTWTLVYTVGAKAVSYHLFMLNRSTTTAASVTVAIGSDASPVDKNEMLKEYPLAAKQNQIGIQAMLPPGHKVWVKAAAPATINVTVYGFEVES